jgi:hypothetical protein
MTPSLECFHKIIDDLQKVREAGVCVFGSDAHDFKMNSRMSEKQILAFESKHQVRLPEDYRMFLQHVGRGGAGPAYGLFNLGEMDDGHEHSKWKEGDYNVGCLRASFPFPTAWNDLSGKPDDSLQDQNEDEYYRLQDEFENRYYFRVDGAIPICHLGCALRQWLVISGPEAGNVWNDNRADYEGFMPEQDGKKKRIHFFRWYRRWLDEAVAILDRSA